VSTLQLLALCWLTTLYPSSSDEVVLIADLNGDHAPEILTSGNQVDQRDTFSLLANRGDGTFASERPIAGGFGHKLEDVADLNRDGIPDLLASDYWGNGIAVYRGLGALQFSGGVPSGTATHGGPSRVLDYDNDGVTDIVSFSFGSGNPVRVHRFRGRADGTFDPKTTIDTARSIAASPSLRFHNGAPEILAGDRSGHLGLFRFAAGGVSVSTLDAGPGFDLNATFADVDGDGTADIVDTNDGGSDTNNPFEWIFVTLARPEGGFRERTQLARPRKIAFPTELRAADFDGDGRIDLVAGDFRGNRLYYYRGDGAGGFDEGVGIDAIGPVNDVAVGDLDGDGRPDLVTANDDHSVSVIVNRGTCAPVRRRSVRH